MHAGVSMYENSTKLPKNITAVISLSPLFNYSASEVKLATYKPRQDRKSVFSVPVRQDTNHSAQLGGRAKIMDMDTIVGMLSQTVQLRRLTCAFS